VLLACSYKHLHGKFVVHPVSQRRIPIIADAELVDMEFGTGAGQQHQQQQHPADCMRLSVLFWLSVTAQPLSQVTLISLPLCSILRGCHLSACALSDDNTPQHTCILLLHCISIMAAGAVKITPAHDPNDFLVGKRHSLEFINILDDNGNINDNGGSFKGQPRFQVRPRDMQATCSNLCCGKPLLPLLLLLLLLPLRSLLLAA
jgi:hypothetical protein